MSDDDHIKALKEALVREKERGDEMRIRTIELLDFTDKSNEAKMARWNALGALEGDVPSMHDIGKHYDEGYGVPESKELAFYWYKCAAEAGDGYAMNDVAIMYSKGIGTMFDGETAIAWYKKAVAVGVPEAKGNLGYCYLCGKCMPRDPLLAVKMFEDLITNDTSRASGRNYYNLAMCYERGDGVAVDFDKACELYRKAQELGCDDATAALERLEE